MFMGSPATPLYTTHATPHPPLGSPLGIETDNHPTSGGYDWCRDNHTTAEDLGSSAYHPRQLTCNGIASSGDTPEPPDLGIRMTIGAHGPPLTDPLARTEVGLQHNGAIGKSLTSTSRALRPHRCSSQGYRLYRSSPGGQSGALSPRRSTEKMRYAWAP